MSISLSLLSQKNLLRFEGKVLYARDLSAETINDNPIESGQVFLPSTGIPLIEVQGQNSLLVSNYSPKISFEASALLKRQLVQKFSFKIGLGLNYFGFTKQSLLNGISGQIVNGGIIPLNNDLQEDCDVINTPSFFLINNIDDANYDILSLRVPLMISYELIEDDFFIDAGFYLQAPIFSRFENNENVFHQTFVQDATICDLERVNSIDKSGDVLRNITTGLTASINYQMNENLLFKLGAQQDLDNIFKLDLQETRTDPGPSHVGLDVSGFSEVYKPLKFFIGAEFLLGDQ